MAHLVNATSYRLGWSTNWLDQWFVDYIYYPEYLYTLLRIRFFLVFMFEDKLVEDSGLFYGHFSLIFKSSQLNIDIFIYDGYNEDLMDKHLLSMTKEFFSQRRLHRFKFKLRAKWFYALQILSILYMLNSFDLKVIPVSFLKYLLNAVLFPSVQSFEKLYNNGPQKAFMQTFVDKYVLFLFSLILRHMSQHANNKADFFIAQLCYVVLGCSRNKFFGGTVHYIEYILTEIFPYQKYKINYYNINNHNVTSTFLSRYIARKLQQNYRLGELIYPIKRELNDVMEYLTLPPPLRIQQRAQQDREIHNLYKARNALFLNLFVFLNFVYDKLFYESYNFTGSLITLNDVSIYLDLKINNKIVIKKNSFQQKLTSDETPLLILNDFCKNDYKFISMYYYYFINKAGYLYFTRNLMKIHKSFNNFSKNYDAQLINYSSESGLLVNFIFYDLRAAFLNLFDREKSDNLMFLVSRAAEVFIKRFVAWEYWTKSLNWLYNGLEINKRNRRNKESKEISRLYGFKITCTGRFTRRLRAVSRTIIQGKMPLTKVSIEVDYAYYVIPLRNSAVSVKVWMYKANSYPLYAHKPYL